MKVVLLNEFQRLSLDLISADYKTDNLMNSDKGVNKEKERKAEMIKLFNQINTTSINNINEGDKKIITLLNERFKKN
jgi:hypothetical protein